MIRHVGFSVRNEERALHFYKDLLGFEIVKKEVVDPKFSNQILEISNLTYIKMAKDGQLIEMYIMPKDSERGRWSHIALTVDNIDKVYSELCKEKIRFIGSPVVDPEKKHKLCFCRDFDGNLLELVQELTEPTVNKLKSKSPQQRLESQIKARRVRTEIEKKEPTTKNKKVLKAKNPFIAKPTKTISEKDLEKEYVEPEE
jgi:catechol 2,3-dioxygenase-like lactoylglutathione lyase family enzyme